MVVGSISAGVGFAVGHLVTTVSGWTLEPDARVGDIAMFDQRPR
jgi:hypothetical protein